MGRTNRRLPRGAVIALLAAALVLCMIGSVVLGRYPIGLRELCGIVLSRFTDIEPFWKPVQESLLLNHRLPRILLACLVGCCLSAAGAAYQGVFQNPMAAPDILGASNGAAFGAALAILLGLSGGMITVFAFAASLATVGTVIYVGSRARGKRVLGLILSGIMIGSLVSSGTSFIKLVADPQDQLPAITYWLMGSFNGADMNDITLAAIPMVIGLVPIFALRWKINILSLGDEEARTLGINAKRVRLIIIICSALITAASVAVSGIIGWVGLVIPHMARRMVGNDYKKLIPATMLFGAIFMLLVDNICRNVWTTDLPIGILTSFVGAPFFIYLITKEGDRL